MEVFHSDIVVIGGGGSGMAAAIEAAQHGASVYLLEKNKKLGGSTAWSVGSVSASMSPHQKEEGILNDHPDDHFEDLGKFSGSMLDRDNLQLRRVLVDNSPAMLQWLMDSGLVFYGPALEEPHRVPRMHNVVPSSKAFPFHLGRQCLKAGVNIKLSMSLDRFLTKEGRVIGVEAISEGHAKVQFHAKKAVIVASGDFSGGQVLKKEYASELAAAAGAVNVTNTGDGHRAALAIGASIINGDLTHGPLIRFVPKAQPNWLELIPPYSWIGHLACWAMKNLPFKLIRPAVMSFLTTALGPDKGLYTQGAILVNKWGQRFSNEKDKPALDLVSQPDRIGYIIMNAAIAKKFNQLPHFISTAPTVAYAFMDDYRKSRPDIYTEASSIEELARRLKMQPEVLSAAVDSTSNNAIPLTGPGFVALGPVKSYVVMTEGGLAVNESHQVLGNDAKVISGLYAVGSAGQGGLLLPGHGHHLGWAFVSGRRAGKLAALSS